jgi:uncharacterized protein
MQNIKAKLAALNWQVITESMNEKGFAIIPGLLTNEQAAQLVLQYNNAGN